MTTAVAEERLAALEAKLDALSHQLDYVAAALREQEGRRGMWDELRRDLGPVTAEALDRVSRELDDVRAFVEPSGMLRMLKRLLRDLPYLEALLDQVESLSQLGADLSPLGREVLVAAMRGLADLEERGYFAFVKGGKELLDRVVASLGPDDLRALADAVPPAVAALQDLAQPEVMHLLSEVAAQLRQPPAEDKGLLRLLWQVRRPRARRGLARVLGLLEALGTDSGSAPAEPSTEH
jgi:hypothetical protein